MIVHMYSDEQGWIYEPHSEESNPTWVSVKGAQMLYQAGWHYADQHRVSFELHEILTKLGHVKPLALAPALEPASPRICKRTSWPDHAPLNSCRGTRTLHRWPSCIGPEASSYHKWRCSHLARLRGIETIAV